MVNARKLDAALVCARTLLPGSIAALRQFISFPSVSAQPRHAADVRRCAAWLAARLRRIGMGRVEIVPTARHPLVLAEWRRAPGRPTLLIYGHYDVQPAEPLEQWTSPPFAPEVRGGHLYGRGASDDKGQLSVHLTALEACLRGAGGLPVNVVCLFDGEEEIGSPSLGGFLRTRGTALGADAAVISDTRMLGPDRPAMVYALRGSLNSELEVCGPAQELHSGSFGGAVHNPLQALCVLIAGLHDAGGRVAIPGFYDRVRRWGPAERAFMARSGPDDPAILRDARAPGPWGERGYSLYERTTIRPALVVTGLRGGYVGPGAKSALPAHASARLNLRLVPDQDPAEVAALLQRHVAQRTPPTVRATVRTSGGTRAALVDRRHPAMRAAARAYRAGFGRAPVLLRSGGTIPAVSMLEEALGIPTVLMGFALPDDRMHAPNERFRLSIFPRALVTSIHFLHELGDAVATTPTSRATMV